MLWGCIEGFPEDAPFIHKLKWDLANSYYWSGNMGYDFVFFVAQWHPWIGILCCHPNHPWTRAERLLMVIVGLSISIVPSVLISQAFHDAHGAEIGMKVVTVAFVTVPSLILSVILYQMAILDGRGKCCTICGPCLRCFQQCMVGITVVIAGTALFCSFILLEGEQALEHQAINWVKALTPLIKGQLFSQLLWFPLWILLPCQLGFLDLWHYEDRAAVMQAQGQQMVPIE